MINMIFELFAKEVIHYDDDDYKILSYDNQSEYDKKEVEKRFKDLLKNIQEVQFKFLDLAVPNISQNYEIRYEKFTVNISDPTYNIAVKRIETRDELIKTYTILKKVYDQSLSYAEKVIFTDFFIINRSREVIEEKLHCGNERFYHIKNSCLIKFALALNWEGIKNKS